MYTTPIAAVLYRQAARGVSFALRSYHGSAWLRYK